jgi:ABC-2 type transport system permease protein
MAQKYSQLTAMMAVTKASLTATFKSPQSIFFSLFFPIVLIWIFGSLGRGGIPTYDVALEKNADTTNEFYKRLKQNPSLHFVNEKDKDVEDELKKGRVTAIIDIQANRDSLLNSPYQIHLRTSSAAQKDYYQFLSSLKSSISEMDQQYFKDKRSVLIFQRRLKKEESIK